MKNVDGFGDQPAWNAQMNGRVSKTPFLESPPGLSNEPTLVAVGPWRLAEFACVRRELDPHGRWPTAPTLDDLVENLTANGDVPPELILLAQSRPAAVPQTAVERLRAAAPLARVIVVAGSWCEGELRTDRPLAGVVRLYWYELAGWLRAALPARMQGRAPAWSKPLDDVHAIRSIDRRTATTPTARHRVVAIDAVDRSVLETLSTALAPFDWRCVWRPRHRPGVEPLSQPTVNAAPIAGIWDGGQLDADQRQSLTAFVAQMRQIDPTAMVIALLDFPRAEYVEIARSAGVTAILAKPYQVAHLANELDRLDAHHSESSMRMTSRRQSGS